MGIENNEFDEIFFRLRKFGIKTQRELAKKLGITPGGVNTAKRRGVFPKGWAVKLSKIYGKSIDWILGLEQPNVAESDEDKTLALMRRMEKLEEETKIKDQEQEVRWKKVEDGLIRLENRFLFLQKGEEALHPGQEEGAG